MTNMYIKISQGNFSKMYSAVSGKKIYKTAMTVFSYAVKRNEADKNPLCNNNKD